MRMYSTDGRSRWPWVIGAGVVVLAAIAAGFYFGTRSGGSSASPTPPASSAPSTSTATPSPTSTGDSGAGDGSEDVAPTGCIAGPAHDADMVLAAQKKALHSTYGAVEVAAAFYKFAAQYPYPSQAQAKAVSSALMATEATPQWRDLAGTFASAGNNPTNGVLPAGSHYYMSLANGLWRVTDAGNGVVSVDLAAGYVVNGELSPTKVGGLGLDMKWENGSWRVLSGHNIDQDALANGGTRFTAGC